MKTLLLLASLFVPLGMSACADDATTTYHNAVTGEECTPNPTLESRSARHAKHPGCDDAGCCEDTKGCDGGHVSEPDASQIENPP